MGKTSRSKPSTRVSTGIRDLLRNQYFRNNGCAARRTLPHDNMFPIIHGCVLSKLWALSFFRLCRYGSAPRTTRAVHYVTARMRIAFDGTVLQGRKSGVGYYCEELLKAMLAANHKDEFFVFSHRRLAVNFPCSNANLKVTSSFSFPIRALYLQFLLPKVLEGIRPDICHYTNFLAPIAENHPYVVTIHDMGLEVLTQAHPLAKRVYTRRLVPRIARKAKFIITNSEYSKWDIVRHLGIPEYRIRVTPLAASPEFRPFAVSPQNPYFLYVGNLEPRKNVERLIEAFARMPRKEHQLLVVGDRWFRGSAAEAKARSMRLNGRVKFLGYVPR